MVRGIGKRFLHDTQYKHMETSDQVRGMPQPPLELPYDPADNFVPLPRPETLGVPAIELRAALEARRTLRAYAPTPLTLDELSWLLWASQGVEKIISRPVTLRTVPSAGARHAFETYVLANRVTGLKPGLYRFLAIEHRLLELDLSPDLAARIAKAASEQEFVAESAATFIWTAVTYRMTFRYGERGYRYILLDAGHACQNLYLAAEPIDCGVCAIAAYDDDELNAVLGLDGEGQFVAYMASLGKKK